MPTRVPAVAAVLLLAAAPAFAQEWYEPNPSLGGLSADDAYARTSAQSLEAAGIEAAGAVKLDAEGRLLVGGFADFGGPGVPPYYYLAQPVVARLLADGSLDPSFGDLGAARVPVVCPGTFGLEVDAAGRVVLVGDFLSADAQDASGPWYLAARLTADGSLDASFSADGLLESDTTTDFGLGGPVRASGADGAMLAVAAKANPTLGQPPLLGVVRIAADGTIDAAYGSGGFAQIAQRPWPDDAADSVADFVVDSAGRAVVAVSNDRAFTEFGSATGVLLLDATGAVVGQLYNSGYGSLTYGPVHARRLGLDGQERIVGLDNAWLFRRLPDGARDPAFGGDGYAWRVATGFAGRIGFPGNVALVARDGRQFLGVLGELAALCAREAPYADFEDPLCYQGELLAVATRADRWALARLVEYRDAKGRLVARGIGVQAIDPANPGAIVSTTYRSRDRNPSRLTGLAIAPDGAAAYALGDTFVLRVDLASPEPMPLPDLRPQWLGYVRAIDRGGGRYQVSARVRIRNVSRRDAEWVVGYVGFGDGTFGVPLAPHDGSTNSIPFRVRARSSVVKRFTWEGGDSSTNLAGVRLGIQVSCELPDANFADNTASSLPITPVYAPR